MAARSLRDRLARRWMAFAACVALLFATAGLLLLFLLEDAFIDRQLEAAARSLASGTKTLAPLPPAFAVHPVDRLPLDIHARMPFAVVAMPRAEFDAWLAGAPRASASPSPATP